MPLTLDTFAPLPWQGEALRDILRTAGGPYGWGGGKGSGKSALVGACASMLAATRPGAEIGLVMDCYTSLRDIHLPILSQLAPSAGGVWRPSDAEFRWSSGSVIRLRHLDTTGDPRIGGSPIEGMNLHALIADECQQIDARYWTVWQERTRVEAVDIAGRRCSPVVIASGLPVNTWWLREVERAGGRTWRPKTRDNTHNAPDYEARVRATMTERQARAMLDGEEYTPEGQIVEEYIPRLEPNGVLTDWQPDWRKCRTVLAMDLGLNNPHAILAAEDAERGRWVIMREWYSTGRHITVGEMCRRIARDAAPRHRAGGRIPIDEIVTDPAGAAHSAQTGHSDLDIIAMGEPDGLGMRPVVETIPERRSVVGSLNRMRLAMERRRLMVHRSLSESGASDETGRSLHRSLLAYRWDPRGKEEPLKDGVSDHAVDALRYLARRVLWHVVEPVELARPQRPDVASGVRVSGRVER